MLGGQILYCLEPFFVCSMMFYSKFDGDIGFIGVVETLSSLKHRHASPM